MAKFSAMLDKHWEENKKKINWKIYIRNFQLTLYPLLISILMISAEWLMKNFFFLFSFSFILDVAEGEDEKSPINPYVEHGFTTKPF